jgi:hypothetical protein
MFPCLSGYPAGKPIGLQLQTRTYSKVEVPKGIYFHEHNLGYKNHLQPCRDSPSLKLQADCCRARGHTHPTPHSQPRVRQSLASHSRYLTSFAGRPINGRPALVAWRMILARGGDASSGFSVCGRRRSGSCHSRHGEGSGLRRVQQAFWRRNPFIKVRAVCVNFESQFALRTAQIGIDSSININANHGNDS